MEHHDPHPVAVVGMSAIMPDASTGDAFWDNVVRGQVLHHPDPVRTLGPGAVLQRGPHRPRQDVQPDRRVGARVRLGPDRLAAADPAQGRRADGRRPAVGRLGCTRGADRRRLAGLVGRQRPGRRHPRQRPRRREALPVEHADPAAGGAQAARGVGDPGQPRARDPRADRRGDPTRLPRQRLRHHRGHDARRARERHRRPGGEPVQPARHELHHGCRVRLRAGRAELGRRPAWSTTSSTPSSPAASTATWASTRS